MAKPRKTVTALRPVQPGRALVVLDGEPWRTVPLEALARAGVGKGVELDRERLRALRRELRRLEALGAAAAALRYRDRSAVELDARLARRGVARAERERALGTLERAGLVDDERFGAGRAAALAERGAGDALILDDLERRGLAAAVIAAALAGLEPETVRAARVVEARGRGAKTARFLAGKGFGEDAIEAAVASLPPDAIS